MPNTLPTDQRLGRSTTKNKKSLVETCNSLSFVQQSDLEEDSLCCEITSIGDKTKNMVLPLPKCNTCSDNMPDIRTRDYSKSASVRKETTEKPSIAENHQLSIGLSDLGTNNKLPLSSRPITTTGRLLPHIGHKHLQKETSSSILKSSLGSSTKLLIPSRKSISVGNLKSTVESSLDPILGEDFHAKYKNDQGSAIFNRSSYFSKDKSNNSECLLSPCNLHALVSSNKHNPIPPSRKTTSINLTPVPPLVSTGAQQKQLFLKKPFVLPEKESKQSAGKTEKIIPGTNFKPIVNIKNIEIEKKQVISRSNFTLSASADCSHPRSEQTTFSGKAYIRNSHPPARPPSSKNKISTVLKSKQQFP